MKKLHILHYTLLCTLIGSGLLYANPPAIDIVNFADYVVNFEITIISADKSKELITLSVLNSMLSPTTYKAPKNWDIQSVKANDLKDPLSLEQYSEKVSVIFDGVVLKERSDYDLYKNSIRQRWGQRVATTLAAFYTGITNRFSTMYTRWQQWRASRQPEYYASGLNQIEVLNKLPYIVTVRGGGQDKEISAGENDTFILNLPQLDVYDAPSKPAEKNLIAIIDLTSYQRKSKKNHNLVVTIRNPTWLEKWYRKEPISYDIEWKADIIEGNRALFSLEDE